MVKRLRQIDYFFIIVVICFAFDLGNVKYALAGLFVLIYVLVSGKSGVRFCFDNIGKRYGTIAIGIGVLLTITTVLQILNGFNAYAINEAIYFFAPLIFVWVYITRTNEQTVQMVMNYIFVVFVVAFLFSVFAQLTIENIRNISFIESYSPFESEKAFVFLLLECYFILTNEKKKAFLSLVLCVLNFKRICMIAAILIFIFSKWFRHEKVISKRVLFLTTVIFTLVPIITCVILRGDFISWFDARFGVSLAEITLSRSQRLELVINSDEIKYGLGSVTPYITQVLNEMHDSDIVNRNLHNDLVRIYLECGVIGSLTFTYVFMKAASFCKPVFLIMCYIFLECYFNHLYGAGTAEIWIIVYMVMAYAGKRMELKMSKNTLVSSVLTLSNETIQSIE